VRRSILALALAAALGGCGGGSNDSGGGDDGGAEVAAPQVQTPEGELSVAQAKEQGGTGITVNGTVYRRLDVWSLCHTLDESLYPPGCGQPTLTISNPDAVADVRLEEGVGQGAGLWWTPRPVSLTGDVSGDAITVSEVADK
jgi:hypothetical protein